MIHWPPSKYHVKRFCCKIPVDARSCRQISSCIAILIGLTTAGCFHSNQMVPASADKLTLYAVEIATEEKPVPDDAEVFYRDLFYVTKKVEITSPAEIKAILKAIRYDIKNPDDQKKCFEPHHGIRVHRGERERDFAICYSCGNYCEIDSQGMTPTIGRTSKQMLDKYLGLTADENWRETGVYWIEGSKSVQGQLVAFENPGLQF